MDEKTILLHYLKAVGGKLFICCDFDLKKLPIKLSAFYEECLDFFAKCSAVNNLNMQDLNGSYLMEQQIQWRESLKTCISTGDSPINLRDEIKLSLSGQIVLLEKAYSKIVYKELRNRIVTPPSAKLKFNAYFVDDTLNWKKIYSLHIVLPWIQRPANFSVSLVTNTFLCKISIIPSPACSLCGESDESLKHLFLSCHYTKNFWSEVIKWLVDHKVN